MQRIRLTLVLTMLFMLFAATVAAAPAAKMTYAKTESVTENGQEILRTEIGIKGDTVDYTVTTKPYLKKQVIVSMTNVAMGGKVKNEMKSPNSLATSITIEEPKKRHSVVTVNMTGQVLKKSYKVYTLPAENDKPLRLIIDVLPMPAGGDDLTDFNGSRTVVIDPGHGGSDSGAIGPSGVREKDICLAVSMKLKKYLDEYGINSVYTRTRDVDVHSPDATATQELGARVNVQYRTPSAGAFVSIHCNAFTNPATNGMETYYFDGSPQGYRLAALLNEELLKAGGLNDRGVRTANFYVLKHTGVPASLVELAFITNYSEERLLADDMYQEKLAKGIAKAINRFFARR